MCGKLGGVRITCFIDSFEALTTFSDVHTFVLLGLGCSRFYSLQTRKIRPESNL